MELSPLDQAGRLEDSDEDSDQNEEEIDEMEDYLDSQMDNNSRQSQQKSVKVIMTEEEDLISHRNFKQSKRQIKSLANFQEVQETGASQPKADENMHLDTMEKIKIMKKLSLNSRRILIKNETKAKSEKLKKQNNKFKSIGSFFRNSITISLITFLFYMNFYMMLIISEFKFTNTFSTLDTVLSDLGKTGGNLKALHASFVERLANTNSTQFSECKAIFLT
jgi:hypothetical protein